MRIQSQDILNIIAQYDNKHINEKELSDWAVGQLEKGIETKSLVLLAGMTPSEYGDALEFLKKAVSEMGYTWPTHKLIKLAYARIIADQIATGEIHPNKGCAIIGEINHLLDWPKELSTFGLLSHDQTGHENVGITSESVIPEIISAAKELLKIKLRF
jgi:hypothetical protein